MAASDKLVVYWVKGDSSSGRNGPYTAANSITFTKADLEAASPAAKNISLPATTGGDYVYIQAWLEFADGTRKSVTSIQGNGIYYQYDYPEAGSDNLGGYYIRLAY